MGPRGFTLLELLVAMAVLAILGTLSFRGLGSVLDAEARTEAESRRWSDLALLSGQLSEDIEMTVERTVRDGGGRVAPALLLRGAPGDAADTGDGQLVLTRLGRGEGAVTQSAPRRVGYRLRGGTLEYLVWSAPDGAPGVAPTAHPVLDNVADLQMQALDNDGRWTSAWPEARGATALPRAIMVKIVLAGGEQITRVLALK